MFGIWYHCILNKLARRCRSLLSYKFVLIVLWLVCASAAAYFSAHALFLFGTDEVSPQGATLLFIDLAVLHCRFTKDRKKANCVMARPLLGPAHSRCSYWLLRFAYAMSLLDFSLVMNTDISDIMLPNIVTECCSLRMLCPCWTAVW